MNGWDNKPSGWENIDFKYNISSDNLTNLDPTPNIDAIFVLAGGIDRNGLCHEWLKRRLKLAYNFHIKNNKPIFCLGGGSYHIEPVLNKNNFVVHESTSCSEYLISLGVEPKNIYKEWSSYDTIANGFFSVVNFILPLQLKDITLITSEFHMPRSKAIFLWLKQIFNIDVNFNFITVSDDNIDDELISSRVEREKESLLSLQRNVMSKINSIESFHKWFFTEHKAYCSDSELVRVCNITDKIKRSY